MQIRSFYYFSYRLCKIEKEKRRVENKWIEVKMLEEWKFIGG
jgi:hypothetical protein